MFMSDWERSYDPRKGHPGKQAYTFVCLNFLCLLLLLEMYLNGSADRSSYLYTFVIRILSTSLTSVSIFSVFCCSRNVPLWISWSIILTTLSMSLNSVSIFSVSCCSRNLHLYGSADWSSYLYTFVIRILSMSLTSVSIFSVCCCSRNVHLYGSADRSSYLYIFVIRILSMSLTSVSTFSVCCCSRNVSLFSMDQLIDHPTSTFLWFVSYRRLSPQFQFSLSAAALEMYFYGSADRSSFTSI